jgi:hypothetical protein
MGKVIQLRKNAARHEVVQCSNDTGTLGVIEMRMTHEGSLFSVNGVYADRLQFAGYTLIKALNEITERICASGTAGFTESGPIQIDLSRAPKKAATLYSWPNPDKGSRK